MKTKISRNRGASSNILTCPAYQTSLRSFIESGGDPTESVPSQVLPPISLRFLICIDCSLRLVCTFGPWALGTPMTILEPNAEKSNTCPILKLSVLQIRWQIEFWAIPLAGVYGAEG